MKKYLAIPFCCVIISAQAQVYRPDHVNAKAIALYEKAMIQLSDGMIKDAVPLLLKSVSLDTNYLDAYLSLAGAYGELKNYAASVEWYEKVKLKDSIYFNVYHLPYSINLAGLGRFEEALHAVNIFLAIPNISERSIKSAAYRKRCYEFAVDYASKHKISDYAFTPVNMGDSINSERSEYYPTVTIDDSLLVFTKRGNGIREDFMQSTMHNGVYSKAKLIEGDINNEPSKGAITVSSDGDFMIFAGNFHRGYGDFDLYISYATPQGWSEPENLGPNINSDYWDSSPSLSPDGRVLYFSSNRPGGFGKKDLYMSVRMANGKWGPAQNMGPTINSVGDEMAPYIHADNQTLYFTSDGLPGYGGTDLFVCRKDLQGNWGKPENLGYPINTIENEGSICVSSNGLTAYYASDRADSRGGLDLYTFNLRDDIRPYKTLYVRGKVFDAKTNKGLPCAVELIDNSNNKA
ncbi:MAG: PD40 domain-containing protein, partial [Bacteroidota bacterium]|nr:PD40 domain-containing protein [Bacteroidota bacterium]